MTDRREDDSRAPDWEPRGSAVGVPNGERRNGSTGQVFEARDGRWVRVRDPARVGCKQPNGLMLTLRREAPTDMPGLMQQIADGPGVRLTGPDRSVAAGTFSPTGGGNEFGATLVDAEFWRLWHDQNAGRNPLLDGGTIFLLDEEEGKPEANPT